MCLKCIAMCVYSYFAPPHDSVILVLLYIEHCKGSRLMGGIILLYALPITIYMQGLTPIMKLRLIFSIVEQPYVS